MPPQMKPIKVWGRGGPNPPKVAIILEELDLPHEIIPWPPSDVKKPEYLNINPNGRLPAIRDPNTDITLWETGAIIEYLIERYDTDHRLSFAAATPESYHAKQWLFFQTTGQGPYFGQAVWFKKYHHEQLPSAQKRYIDEVNRVVGVLETHLSKQQQIHGATSGPWLVSNKMSFADIAFVPYQNIVPMIFTKDEYNEDNFPLVKDWLNRLTSRKAIKKVLDDANAAYQQATQK